ncbi:hypothetical protein BE221DRAFT_81548 [Ostreococcus tauri]|uniref:Coenzyme Q-binding protein COQ10 START domain-containing protein n=1 Tax=Ostreococcus tauri TaxID=70448 RepID=A0A1Y5I7H2_OSTTA|nr:hypothetical protein BE221DRAFT_81548 [Ostreococcus tauri]
MSAPRVAPAFPGARRRVERECVRVKIHEKSATTASEDGRDGPGDEWTRCASRARGGVDVWTRPAPRSAGAREGVKEILAECTFEDVDRGALWRAICDLDRYDEFVPYVRSARVLVKRGTKTWSAATVRAPVAGDRDYTIEIEDLSDGRAGVNAGRWKTTREHEPPLPPGRARMRCNCGSWELRDVESGIGRGVRVRYTLITDPGKGMPTWLLSQTPRTVPDVLRAFRSRALSGKSERGAAASSAYERLGIVRNRIILRVRTFADESRSFVSDVEGLTRRLLSSKR